MVNEYGRWLDILADLIRRPPGVFPMADLAAELCETFEACTVAANWTACGVDRVKSWPQTVPTELMDAYLRSGALAKDPLARWFRGTGSMAPQVNTRLPAEWSHPDQAGPWLAVVSVYAPWRLTLPLELAASREVVLTVARDHDDFADEHIALASRLGPVLHSLWQQADAIRRGGFAAELMGADLTSREAAVLALLAQGLKTTAIGHRLGISPRTVSKHQENLYRKLDVRDRLSAVLIARSGTDLGRS